MNAVPRHALVFWVIWAAIFVWLFVMRAVFGIQEQIEDPAEIDPLIEYAGFIPLFFSIILRWLALPKAKTVKKALPIFIAGIALAEACGILALFLSRVEASLLFSLSVLGVLQFVPLWAKDLESSE